MLLHGMLILLEVMVECVREWCEQSKAVNGSKEVGQWRVICVVVVRR